MKTVWHLEEPEATEIIYGQRTRYANTERIYFTSEKEDNLDERASKPCIVTYYGLDRQRHVSEVAAIYYDGEWWWFHEEDFMDKAVVPILAWTEMPEIYEGEEEADWR